MISITEAVKGSGASTSCAVSRALARSLMCSLEETPLVPRLGLLLRGESAVVLRAGHLTRSQPGQQCRHHCHHHRGGAKHLAPLGVGHIRFQLLWYLHFHDGWFAALPVAPPEEHPHSRISSSCHIPPCPASANDGNPYTATPDSHRVALRWLVGGSRVPTICSAPTLPHRYPTVTPPLPRGSPTVTPPLPQGVNTGLSRVWLALSWLWVDLREAFRY
jgi:hypothetical protein